jgi:uncharacterized protein (DUF924 family)
MSPETVLTFWIGPLDADGLASEGHAQRWWTKDPGFDAEIRRRFEATWRAIMDGRHDAWLAEARGRLAYVVVLDQFSRNMFRADPAAFAGDARALAAAREGLSRGHDRELRGQERIFLYMPFMHSEALADQELCVELFRTFRAEAPPGLATQLDEQVDYAIRHRDVIARFGRFPHRNQVLSRASTPEELEFLKQPGSSF